MAGNLLQVGLRGKLVAGGVIEGKILGCLNVEMERRALSLHSSKFQFGPPHLRTASRVKPVAGRVIEGQTLGCLNVEKWNVERDKGPALKRTSKFGLPHLETPKMYDIMSAGRYVLRLAGAPH